MARRRIKPHTKRPEAKEWNGQYVVKVELFENEFVYDTGLLETIGMEKNLRPLLFDTEAQAIEYAKKWNTGEVVKYMG